MSSVIQRRDFLQGSAAALASTTLAAAAGPEIRTAFIGTGNRGAGLLGQALTQDNVRVAAICDIDSTARDQALSKAGRDNPRSFTDYRRLLDLKDIDAVFIGTPCDLHAEMAAACLEAGKYVYCEKPLGITPQQIELALRAARRSPAFLQIGQQLRYFPALREVIRQIHQERVLGEAFVIKAQRHSTPARPDPQRAPRPAWYDDVKRSGDLIVENAVHNLDVCNWVADSRPASAYGHGKRYLPQPLPPGSVMMDGFSVQYIYQNDMHLDYSQLYLHPRALKALPNGQWYVIFGEKGAVHLTHDNGLLYEAHAQEPRPMVTPAQQAARENALADFFACIREKRQPFAGVRVAAIAALTAILGREAIYKGRSVAWKELGVEV